MSSRLRVALCADFREERWPSMDRVADRLMSALEREHRPAIEVAAVRPPFRRRATRVAAGRLALNIDRGLNRLVDYPRHVGRLTSQFDIFHVVDHSYAQLVHSLPAERTVVTCHDLDTFRTLFRPDDEPRPAPFRAMTRHILGELRRAGCVTCDTGVVRDEIVSRGLVTPDRVVVVPVGVGDEFSHVADPEADTAVAGLLGSAAGGPEVLHVGSTSPRKRIDVVLRACAELRRLLPSTRLVRVGGPLTPDQERLAIELGIQDIVSTLPVIDDRLLAAVYRRASVVVLPSDREGFGLPVVEALGCGTPVVARDLPVLREVGGQVAMYCRTDEPGEWAGAARAAAESKADRGAGDARAGWARRFTWNRFAAGMVAVYARVARAGGVEPADEWVVRSA